MREIRRSFIMLAFFHRNRRQEDKDNTNKTLQKADQNDTVNVAFGNVCFGAGGGLTLDFWSNKNGQKLETADDFSMLTNLCLRNADGTDRNFTGKLTQNKSALATWLLNAAATNMAYMLSAQLAAMELNVAHGFVSGAALVHTGGCGNAGFDGSFITISDLMAAATRSYAHTATRLPAVHSARTRNA